MAKTVFAAALLLLASFAFAAVIDWNALDCAGKTYQGVSFADANITLPQNFADLLNGETVFLNVSAGNGADALLLSGKVDSGMLHGISCGRDSGATFEVITSRAVMDRIAASASPVSEFKGAVSSREITINPLSVTAFVKTFLMNLVLMFY